MCYATHTRIQKMKRTKWQTKTDDKKENDE